MQSDLCLNEKNVNANFIALFLFIEMIIIIYRTSFQSTNKYRINAGFPIRFIFNWMIFSVFTFSNNENLQYNAFYTWISNTERILRNDIRIIRNEFNCQITQEEYFELHEMAFVV